MSVIFNLMNFQWIVKKICWRAAILLQRLQLIDMKIIFNFLVFDATVKLSTLGLLEPVHRAKNWNFVGPEIIKLDTLLLPTFR